MSTKFAKITWNDACGSDGYTKDGNDIPRSMILETVGHIVKEDKHGVIVAQDYITGENPRFRQTLSIPKAYIVKKTMLKPSRGR